MSCSTMVKDTAIAKSARLASSHAFRPTGPAAAIVATSRPTRAWPLTGRTWQTPMAIRGASPAFTTTVAMSTQIIFSGSRICLTLKVMPRLATSVSSITTIPPLNRSLASF